MAGASAHALALIRNPYDGSPTEPTSRLWHFLQLQWRRVA